MEKQATFYQIIDIPAKKETTPGVISFAFLFDYVKIITSSISNYATRP